MTEGAVAVYMSLATALAVWMTIAIYLGRVGARLRTLQRELESIPLEPPPPRVAEAAGARMSDTDSGRATTVDAG